MESNDNKELEIRYSSLSDEEIIEEFKALLEFPDARNNIEALTRLSVLIPIMESRGIDQEKAQYGDSISQSKYKVNWGEVLFGFTLFLVGCALTQGSSRIMIGAICVGIAYIIKGLVG